MSFFMKLFFSKYDQIRRNLQIWSHLLKKTLMENFIFGAVIRNVTVITSKVNSEFLIKPPVRH